MASVNQSAAPSGSRGGGGRSGSHSGTSGVSARTPARASKSGNKSANRVDPQRLRRVMSRLPSRGATLIVDDNRFDLETYRIKLGIVLGPGVEIVTAAGVNTALSKYNARSGRFDLLLLNDAKAFALKTMLDGLPQPHARRLVLFSSNLNPKLAQDAIQAGFTASVHADRLDSMSMMSEVLWSLVKPDIDWSASWRGLP